MAGAGATSRARTRHPYFWLGLQAQPGMGWPWAVSDARLGHPKDSAQWPVNYFPIPVLFIQIPKIV
jgi:hypothetical protein